MRHHQLGCALNPPWKTWDKDADTLDTMDAQQFYEGAINVTAFGLNPCISTLLTNTRSSKETTASLYDYARREFNVCASKSGTKFNDLDADGTRDTGEPGLAGWTINLYQDTGTKGSYDGEPVFKSDVTDTNGAYSFNNLLSGDYIVCEVLQATWTSVGSDVCPSGETLVTNCPGPTNGYAFTMGGSDRSGNDFGNFQRGALRIVKNSTKTDQRVTTAGAVFNYQGPSAPAPGTSVTDDITAAAPDEDEDIGEVCVSDLLPGSYSVDETSAPPGYGDAPGGAQTVTVVGGTDCTPPNVPGAGATATFTNPPLADVQMRFRDGGSGETFLVNSDGTVTPPPTITCNNVTGSTSTANTTGWANTTTVTGIEIGANVVTVVCTARIDP